MSSIAWVALGLALLVAGAELLVRGASRLARAVGVSPLVIGLTVVAYGTSAPELAVNVKAGLAGQADIAVGNAVGSNIYNVLLILGVSALVVPLAVSMRLVRLDVPIMIGVSALAWFLALDGGIGRADGTLLLAGCVAYTAFALAKGRHECASADEKTKVTGGRAVGFAILFVLAGLGLLVVGAGWLVDGAAGLARALGVSELVIGLTIVAAGTSLPETATSIVAAARGERDIAVGNIVGSNIFNVLAVLGIAGAVSGNVPVSAAAMRFDIPVMIAVAVACLPIFFTGGRISRWEGALFTAYYVAYVTYLVLAASHHDLLSAFSAAMLWFALPATALGIGLSLYYAAKVREIKK